jgi:myosin-crossreactive antigen
MKYLKIFEEFISELTKTKKEEISDTTIEDVLKDDFFDKTSYIDNNGIIHIIGWKYY